MLTSDRRSSRSCAVCLTATHCNTLQHTGTHCNTLQYNATHCNALQHTTTHRHGVEIHDDIAPLELAQLRSVFDVFDVHEEGQVDSRHFKKVCKISNRRVISKRRGVYFSTGECMCYTNKVLLCVCSDLCMYVCIYENLNICIYVNISIYICIHMYRCIYMNIYKYTYMYKYIYTYISMYIYAYIYNKNM